MYSGKCKKCGVSSADVTDSRAGVVASGAESQEHKVAPEKNWAA